MSNPRLLLLSAALSALICAIIAALLMGVSAVGTSVALPGAGIIVAGPLVAALLGALMGGAVGFMLGLLAGLVIIVTRRRTPSPS